VDKSDKPMLQVLQGYQPDHTPVWLMRQAGRYLPEYRDLRAKAKNFLNMCLTPEWASEITLQPIRRFDFDAAIIFADILLIPLALGQGLEFREGEGPVLEKMADAAALGRLNYDSSKLQPVYQSLRLVQAALPKTTALIGFCGAPWTVACYMIDGTSKQNFVQATSWAERQPDVLDRLIAILVEASTEYLCQQIEAGAEILQIFDSWAGLLAGAAQSEQFQRFIIKPTAELIHRVKARYPHIPIIGFPREAGQNGYAAYIRETGCDALSIDQNVDLIFAKENLQSVKPLQGNLAPELLVQGGAAMKTGVEKILTAFGSKHIFNLGHGVVPQTPPEHVAELVECVRQWKP